MLYGSIKDMKRQQNTVAGLNFSISMFASLRNLNRFLLADPPYDPII